MDALDNQRVKEKTRMVMEQASVSETAMENKTEG